MMKFRDRLWLWGQNPGSHHQVPEFGLSGENKMDALTGCRFFGIPNCCRVAMAAGPVPPFDDESAKLVSLRQVVWSAVGSRDVERTDKNKSDIDEVLRQAAKFPNVTGAVLDDFFSMPEDVAKGAEAARHSLGNLRAMRDKLKTFSRPLDLWVVWYEEQLDMEVDAHLACCDVATFWVWNSKNIEHYPDYWDKVVRRTPGKRRFAGIYLWDYGAAAPMPVAALERQLSLCYEEMRKGTMEGAIICSNCIADIGLETVPTVRKWIELHADEEF